MKTDLITHCPLSQHFWKRFGDGSLHCFTILSLFITNSFIHVEPERKAPLIDNDAFDKNEFLLAIP